MFFPYTNKQTDMDFKEFQASKKFYTLAEFIEHFEFEPEIDDSEELLGLFSYVGLSFHIFVKKTEFHVVFCNTEKVGASLDEIELYFWDCYVKYEIGELSELTN